MRFKICRMMNHFYSIGTATGSRFDDQWIAKLLGVDVRMHDVSFGAIDSVSHDFMQS